MRRRALAILPFGLLSGGMARVGGTWDFAVPMCVSELRPFTEDRDADFLEKLGLLEGHLLVGRRLLEANESRLAVPHFGHPIRELYTYVEARLNERNLAGFEAELSAMENFAERGGRGTAGIASHWDSLMPKLRAAQNAVPAERRGNARFMLDHVGLMAFNVASDYAESIERGRIINVVEYHDSMGFLMYAMAIGGGRGPPRAAAGMGGGERHAHRHPRPGLSGAAALAAAADVGAGAARAERRHPRHRSPDAGLTTCAASSFSRPWWPPPPRTPNCAMSAPASPTASPAKPVAA